MSYFRRHYAYSKVESEDPDEQKHRRAQYLIARVLEQADSRRRHSSLRLRICKLKIKIGRRLKRLRKRVQFTISITKLGLYQHLVGQLKLWKSAISGSDAVVTLPPFFG